jgi:diadenosine tetraphosphatase ApaH/serine/threonine PP2A family protein phosphatase
MPQEAPNKDEILNLLDKIKSILKEEPSLLRIKAKKAVFIGDTHGDFESTEYVFDKFYPKGHVLVFLGDYVDRGPHQLRNISFLLEKKAESPSRVILLRGNHEIQELNRVYGFLEELLELYDEKDAYLIWNKFNEVFSYMSYACLVNGRILAVHGGLPSGLTKLKQINEIKKGETDPADEIAIQLLWNDPSEDVREFAPSPRGRNIMQFGRRPLQRFMRKNGISLMIRSHEHILEGAKYLFTHQSEGKYGIIRRSRGIFTGERYPGLLLSILTCRYYDSSTPAVAVLEGENIYVERIPVEGGGGDVP